MTIPRYSTSLVWFLTCLAWLSGSLYSLIAFSSFPLGIEHIFQALVAFDPTSIEQQILTSIRLPRVMSGLVIGANLAIAGLLMQGLTQNPLASPSVLGINAGAACLMALASINIPILNQLPSVFVAALGGLISGFSVMLLGGFFTRSPHPLKLVLAGIAMSALLVGVTRAAIILADDKAYTVISWLAGSLSSLGWAQWQTLWPVSVIGIGLALYVARQLNLLALGHDVATSLGLNITLTRLLTCLAIVLLTGASVAVAGPIGFIGLIVPHVARKCIGHNFLVLIPACALLGGALISWSDALSRAIAFPAETPVGVITALIGTPFFIFLAVKAK